MRILITMRRAVMRSALGFYLRNKLDLEEVVEAADIQDLLAQAEVTQPDIILLDWHFSNQPLAALIQTLKQLDFGPGVILINVPPEYQQKALAAGADALVFQGEPAKKLLIAIETIRLKQRES